ncbi:DUF6883 domain-containing protein [uncultured Nostoc sp.]|uniref:DUF6883 domain-containing protein n=1 Tax=uncultured Nostoc sp. TaxID=340711 RepID=UPI003459E987
MTNGEQAEISVQKLIGYCLNSEHSSGKHKARVFASILGITLENADVLRELIQTAAVAGEVVQQSTTQFGQQFKVDWIVPDTHGIRLRTIWETTANNPYPRLITAFLKLNEQN